jgi:hypothetical protein
VRIILLVGVIFCCVFGAAWAEQTPEVKKLAENGLAAAKNQKWDEAIKYFYEARSKSPLDPLLLFNLALACDKSRGREMGAIVCYRAYLALKPDADNAMQVKKRIAELSAKVEDDAKMLVKKSLDLSSQMGTYKGYAYYTICLVQATMGDLDAAMQTARTYPQDEYPRGKIDLYATVAQALAARGRYDEAGKLIDEVVGKTEEKDKIEARDAVLAKIVQGKCERKDFNAALKDVEAISPQQRFYSYSWISMQQVFAQDIEGSLKNALLVSDAPFRAFALCKVANAQNEAGDKAGVAKTVAYLGGTLKEIPADNMWLRDINRDLTQVYADAGMLKEAEAALASIGKCENNPYTPGTAEAWICRGMALKGDIEGAKKRAAAIKHDPSRNFAFRQIAQVQIKANDSAGAAQTIMLIENEMDRLQTKSQLAEKLGNIAEAEGLGWEASITYSDLEELESLAQVLEKLQSEKPSDVAYLLANNAYKRVLFLDSQRKSEEYWAKKKPAKADTPR